MDPPSPLTGFALHLKAKNTQIPIFPPQIHPLPKNEFILQKKAYFWFGPVSSRTRI